MSNTQDYSLTYPGDIKLSLEDNKLEVTVGSDTKEYNLSDVDETITDASGFEYQLKGLTLFPTDAGSDALPIFPVQAQCNATLPPTAAPTTSLIPYLLLGLVLVMAAVVVFLVLYGGQNRWLLMAQGWLKGKK